MTKSCLLLGVWIPSRERIEPYLNILKLYYGDCDIFIGVNPSAFVQDLIDELDRAQLNYKLRIVPEGIMIRQHASANQIALQLYSESHMQYEVVHVSHTKGISYDHYHHQRAFGDYYVKFGEKRLEIEQYLAEHEEVGGYGLWGMCQPQVFCKPGYDLSNIPMPPVDINYTMAQNSSEATDLIHPYFDLRQLMKEDSTIFTHPPQRTQFLIAIYSIKNFLVKAFVENVRDEFYTKSVNELGYDLYFFETQFPFLVDYQGYERKIENVWNIGNYGDAVVVDQMVKLWKTENNK